MTFKMPNPLPIPTDEEIRATGWTGEVTQYPLTVNGYLARCEYNGANPEQPPNNAWYYAPNQVVQTTLEKSVKNAKKLLTLT